jgi:3-hydroxybutyrate dehydrogenase
MHPKLLISREVEFSVGRACHSQVVKNPQMHQNPVKCICPRKAHAPLICPQADARAAELGADREAAVVSLLAEKQPRRRLSMPREISSFVFRLTNSIAHNVTGVSIPVDDGWTA